MIGGGDTQRTPMYIRLVHKAGHSSFIDDGEYIDIRTESIDDFINGKQSCTFNFKPDKRRVMVIVHSPCMLFF